VKTAEIGNYAQRVREIGLQLHQLDLEEQQDDERRREQRCKLQKELIELTREANS